jgi:hypothetical protein
VVTKYGNVLIGRGIVAMYNKRREVPYVAWNYKPSRQRFRKPDEKKEIEFSISCRK